MQKLKILHIANDYTGSKVYNNLVKNIDRLVITQFIYTPIRQIGQIGKNNFDFHQKESKIYYQNILSLGDRFFFNKKIKKIVNNIEEQVQLNEVSLIHAHTWFSDGGVAYELYKKYNIPYIVTVRNTDLNLFFKYMIHLRRYGVEILTSAQKLVFISPIYKERLFEKESIASVKNHLELKSIIIPNGIDSFWLNNVKPHKILNRNKVNLLFIGKFTKGKNVMRLLKAVEKLNIQGANCHLHLVGGGGKEEKCILEYIKLKNDFTFQGKILAKEKLMSIYQICDIFTMPSIAETFGLVYIEALSQGLPVVYTINEGIYGFYDNSIGEAVNCKSINEIADGIDKIIKNYDDYKFDIESIMENHDWSEIAKNYSSLYKDIIK
jgi:glycosyltransferase involved in cell wall biosynthesis